MKTPLHTVCAVLLLPLVGQAADSFYKETPIFSTAPGIEKSMSEVGRFGPVGVAIELHQPPFVMQVGDIEAGSPAAAAAGLKKGQIIESINGESLKDIDPRIQLGRILEAAEAKDGVIRFKVKDKADAPASEVVVKIPVLGAYSRTWPLNCPKSDKITQLFAEQIAKPDGVTGFGGGAMLTLLGTGDDKYLPAVKAWVDKLAKEKGGTIPWRTGIGGIALCEYYLRTGDPVALEVIQSWVDISTKQEYLDGWAGRGGVVGLGYGSGHLNAGGTQVVTFLMLAKQCGAKINDSLLHRTLTHFFRFAGRGVNPYGDHRPETSFVDNGKNGNLSFAMAAAASLTPEGEESLYAKARDITAMSSFYTTTYMLHGHTGGGVGEVWRSAAMGFLHEKKPLQYREFMDGRKWHYDLSRRFDGTNAILGGAGYDNTEWGGLYTWAYVMPRKTLRITGAPPSKFSKTYQLPKRPWGTAADDVFLSLEAAPDKDGKRMDVSGEVLAKDSAKPLIDRIQAQGELSDDEIRRYVRHPEYLIRHMIANHAAGMTCAYMFAKPECRVRPDLIKEFARDADPRVRNAGLRAAITAFNPEADWCKELFAQAVERLKDEQESWYIKDACLALIAKGTPDMIAPHVDLLISYLGHSEQWLQNGALTALTVVSVDESVAGKVLPVMAEFIRKTPRQSTTSGPLYALREKMAEAPDKVREVALKALGDIYGNYINPSAWEGGQDLTGHSKQTYELFAGTLAAVPGGYDVLYKLAKQRQPAVVLPHENLFLEADPSQFGPELQKAMQPIIREKLIYQYVARNRNKLFTDIAKPSQKGVVTDSVDGLVSLYQKIGVRDYDWKEVGDLSKAKWNYFSFDPAEKQAYDKSPWRYRTVTLPKGMEQWNTPGFDAAKAGWKQGLFPIGQYNGKLADNGVSQRNLWPQPPKSLWENEVLLVTGSFQLPPFKDGCSYRLRIDRGQGVGAGDGFKVFINGKPLVESTEGLGRRAGDTIRGGWLTSDFAAEFAKGPVTISCITFLRYGDRAIVQMPPLPQGIFSMWIEERKLPPLDSTVLQKAVEHVPMMTSEWKAPAADASGEEASEVGIYHYDGKFAPNPAVVGRWQVLGVVDSIDAFAGGAKPASGRTPFRAIELKDGGFTDSNAWFWSGAMLFDLDRASALKVTPKAVGGVDHLLIEAGGWGPKMSPTYKPQWVVLKRQ